MMAFSTLWWLLAGIAVVAELLTGTVYLLLIGAGFVAAALVAHGGLSLPLQTVVAAVVGSALVLLWWRVRAPTRRAAVAPQASRDLNLDIGQTVQVDAWSADGSASVMHRGARWTVVAEAPSAPPATLDGQTMRHRPGLYRIVALSGSSLVVTPLTA